MFFHNFKYTLINLFKNKALIFWTFAFPLILGTFFSMAFHDIEKNESLDVFSIAFVNNSPSSYGDIMQNAFVELSNLEDKIFDLEFASEEKAKELLLEDKIVGYVIFDESFHVVVNQSGIYETVLKTVTETIAEEVSLSELLMNEKLESYMESSTVSIDMNQLLSQVQEEVTLLLETENSFLLDSSPGHIRYTMIEFYTLIAMTALYGGILTMTSLNHSLPNMSFTGKRVAVTPTKKSYVVFSSLFASFLVQLVGLALLFLYTIFVLHIDYGTKIFYIFLLSILGSVAGLALGMSVAVFISKNENTKLGILLAITMLGCFFSGMMGITMKYVIDTNLPILNLINPASMITDGFYALYYYETNSRYFFDVGSLFIFSFLLIVASVWSLRRQKYDSI